LFDLKKDKLKGVCLFENVLNLLAFQYLMEKIKVQLQIISGLVDELESLITDRTVLTYEMVFNERATIKKVRKKS